MSKRGNRARQTTAGVEKKIFVVALLLILIMLIAVGASQLFYKPVAPTSAGTHQYLKQVVLDLSRGIKEAEDLYSFLDSRSENYYLATFNLVELGVHKERLKREKKIAFVIIRERWVQDKVKVPFAGVMGEFNTLYIFENSHLSDYSVGSVLLHELKHLYDHVILDRNPKIDINNDDYLDFELSAHDLQAQVANKLTGGEIITIARRLAVGQSFPYLFVDIERATYLGMDKLLPQAKGEEEWIRGPVYLYIYNKEISKNSGLKGEELDEAMRLWYAAYLKHHGYNYFGS